MCVYACYQNLTIEDSINVFGSASCLQSLRAPFYKPGFDRLEGVSAAISAH